MINSLHLPKPPSETRVVVAMSGGVDSSAAAALLHEEGYEVIGLTMQLYDHAEATARTGKTCCAGQDIHDARRVAETLGIPHYVLNFESKFRRQVMEDFAAAYLAGETPIPCVRCNQSVKFRDLLGMARDLGADALATGHYVRRVETQAGPELWRAADEKKDQSYFLFATTREQLEFLRFPLGERTKEETRNAARRLGLPISGKPDSQDICFVPGGDYAKVIEQLRPGACDPGDIVHIGGAKLGEHRGIIHFTVGQRRGLGIDDYNDPLFVVRLEPETRRVIVGPREALREERFTIREVNWLGGGSLPERVDDIRIRWRSSQPLRPATLYAQDDGTAEIALHEPQEAVAPGQACVLYQGERVLGGGWITRRAASA